MVREILTVTSGVLLASVIRSLLSTVLNNTLIWYVQFRGICQRCSRGDSEYRVRVSGEDQPICSSCARREFGEDFIVLLQHGTIRPRKKLDKDGGF